MELQESRSPLRALQKGDDSFPSHASCVSFSSSLLRSDEDSFQFSVIAHPLRESVGGEATSCIKLNRLFLRFRIAGGMSIEVRSDAITYLDVNETELRSFEAAALGEKVNVAQRALDGVRPREWPVNNISTPIEYRYSSERSSKGTREARLDIVSPIVDGDERREHRKKTGPLLSGTAYCISSCSMILLNKIVLSRYSFNAGISLMFYQNFISTVIVVFLGLCGAVSIEKPNRKLINMWIPVNLIFIGMLVSGMYSLKHINVAMVTILKNVTNILTAIGEFYIFRKRQNEKVWIAMLLMIISAICGGITDLSFSATGYVWQMINCILTASYSLTLRRVMDNAKHLTRSGSLNEVSMVLLNNLLSLPFAICLIFLFDEWDYIINVEVTRMPMFWAVATASGLLGLAISFTSMWFLKQTGPTTYSLVGSLNKIPISIAGLVLFKVPLSLSNFFSIVSGLFAGILFAKAKMS